MGKAEEEKSDGESEESLDIFYEAREYLSNDEENPYFPQTPPENESKPYLRKAISSIESGMRRMRVGLHEDTFEQFLGPHRTFSIDSLENLNSSNEHFGPKRASECYNWSLFQNEVWGVRDLKGFSSWSSSQFKTDTKRSSKYRESYHDLNQSYKSFYFDKSSSQSPFAYDNGSFSEEKETAKRNSAYFQGESAIKSKRAGVSSLRDSGIYVQSSNRPKKLRERRRRTRSIRLGSPRPPLTSSFPSLSPLEYPSPQLQPASEPLTTKPPKRRPSLFERLTNLGKSSPNKPFPSRAKGFSLSRLSLVGTESFEGRLCKREPKEDLRNRRRAIKSCIVPESPRDEFYPYQSNDQGISALPSSSSSTLPAAYRRGISCPQDSSRKGNPSSSSLGSKFRRATSSARKELRKTLRSLSLNVSNGRSPQCSSSKDLDQDPFAFEDPSLPNGWSSYQYLSQCSSPGGNPPAIFRNAIFPWRQGRIGGDVENDNTDSEEILLHIKKEEDWDERHRADKGSPGYAEGYLHPRVSVPKDIRREKATSSPSISRSSLSHSEWDIRRPWSEVYSENDPSSVLSQSVYRLPEATSSPSGGQISPLPFGEEGDDHGEGDDAPLSLPYIVPSGNASQTTAEGVFQKFKKSLSLRLVKKTSNSESPEERLVSTSPIGQSYENNQSEVVTLPRRTPTKEEDNKSTFLFGHPIFRSSKERRRAKLRDARSSKCNSGDSGDSGIEIASGSCPFSNEVLVQNGGSTFYNLNNFDSSVICSTDISEQNGLASSGPPNGQSGAAEDLKYQKIIRRTCSDIGGNLLRQGRTGELSQAYGRQYSSPQPIKIRPSHRLPNYSLASNVGASSTRFKRSKGSAHLRRSVSQPLDLDKSFETQVSFLNNLHENEDLGKKQRRPSVGNLLSEENTSEEDVEASDSEELQRDDKSSLDEENSIVYAEALWDHVSLDSDELVFKAGDLITVVDSSDKDWWWGRISTRIGWFPSVFVRLLVNQEDHQQKPDATASENLWSTRRLSLTKISHDQIRANVINEIISTERDFVKHLRDLVEGYLRQVRKRPDMFSKECIATIFGNIEELYSFQSRFLAELEECIDYEEPFRSSIGECFIRNRSNFEAYSEYCNNHPLAVSKLQELYRQQKFVHFFEACRLLQEMIDISLDGFLLTPVQKICKYPLQLQELLKYTKPSHLDYVMVQGATQAMKEVALLVNERKRRMECLEKIASWQMAVEGWEGPDLLDDSSQLIHQGELTKGIVGPWSKEVTLFLFDHQAVYCKRDLLKRSTYVYRGRINTDLCEVIDIPDGKESQKSATLLHSWKIHCLDKNKTYVFACKSAQDKEKWLSSFRKERALVAFDEEAGFVVSEKQKQVAKISAKNHKNRPKKPRTMKPSKRVQAMTFAQAQLLVNTEFESESRSNSLPLGTAPPAPPPDPKKKGNWFSFGVHKKSKQSVGTIPV